MKKGLIAAIITAVVVALGVGVKAASDRKEQQ